MTRQCGGVKGKHAKTRVNRPEKRQRPSSSGENAEGAPCASRWTPFGGGMRSRRGLTWELGLDEVQTVCVLISPGDQATVRKGDIAKTRLIVSNSAATTRKQTATVRIHHNDQHKSYHVQDRSSLPPQTNDSTQDHQPKPTVRTTRPPYAAL
jgi:hypothetical protein